FVILFTSSIVKGDLVADVCARASQPPLCEKLIRSDPRSKTKDLDILGAITFNMTTPLIRSTIDLSFSLRDNATNPTLKRVYLDCGSYIAYAYTHIMIGMSFLGTEKLLVYLKR
ncbi:hypothetical protein MTR67_052545, partial [Solanum verrucosum]